MVITHYILIKIMELPICKNDLTNLAPKKTDWDLKRDISKKLDKLERRIQKAILELLSEQSFNFWETMRAVILLARSSLILSGLMCAKYCVTCVITK